MKPYIVCLLIIFLVKEPRNVICSENMTDTTLIPGAAGAAVVEASVIKLQSGCIFDDDRQLLRRTAFVETHDGEEPGTFPRRYHGGIWKMDKDMYLATKSQGAAPLLDQYISKIKTKFDIDWYSTEWKDLRMAFYSLIGARLYYIYSSNNEIISGDIDDQSIYWKTYYRPEGDPQEFIDESEKLEETCESMGVDLVFILDESGSVGSDNFQKMKEFTRDVIDGFDIGEEQTRVAVITYASFSSVDIYLHDYYDKNELQSAVMNLQYSSGGTNTHVALQQLLDEVYIEENGARSINQGITRVTIIITDGGSADTEATLDAADEVQANSITMFSIAVTDNVNENEIYGMASTPKCIHIIRLEDFDEFESLSSTIERATCDAPFIYDPNENGTTVSPPQFPPGFGKNCKLSLTDDGTTIRIEAEVGSAIFYTASDTYPSEAYYEDKITAEPGYPGVLYMPHSGSTPGEIFCRLVSDLYNKTELLIGLLPGNRDQCKDHKCRFGVCIDMGDGYECECDEGYQGKYCDIAEVGECGDHGKCNQCLCDDGWTGDKCESPVDEDATYDCEKNNPCTEENIAKGLFLWPHHEPSKYVECHPGAAGVCWERDCPPGTVWNDDIKQCDYP